MNKKQTKAAIALGAALAVLIYVVPALAELDSLIPSIVLGAVCLIVMGICVFKGGLTDVSEG